MQETADMTLRTSTLRRLVRRTAYIRRALWNLLHRRPPWLLRQHPLTVEEEEEALWCLVRREQSMWYEAELKALRDPDESMPAKSQILRLNPFIDAAGILRVGGRLEAAAISYEEMHPALLPEVSHLAQLLVRNANATKNWTAESHTHEQSALPRVHSTEARSSGAINR